MLLMNVNKKIPMRDICDDQHSTLDATNDNARNAEVNSSCISAPNDVIEQVGYGASIDG